MKRYIIIILFLGSHVSLFCQFNKVGRTALQFLKIGNGAQQVAQGEACIASITDINAVFWNPAAIGSIEGVEAAFNYTSWIGDLKILSGAAGFGIPDVGVLSINFIKMDYGDIEEALIRSSTGGLDTRTGSVFSGNDMAVGLTFARYFTDKLSIGISIKYLKEELYIYDTSVWAFDVGSYYNTGWKGIRLAMSAQNFSSEARWLYTLEEEQQNYELPLSYRIGVSIDLIGGEDLLLGGDPKLHKLKFSADAIHLNDYSERVNIGAEYVFLNTFALRGGYKINYDEGNLSFGFGVQQEIADYFLKFDYAYVNYDFLDSPHRFTLTFSF